MKLKSEWRSYSINEIAKGLVRYENEVGELNLKTAAWVSKHCYPFHQRMYHPYHIWCSEITVLKTFLSLVDRKATFYPDWRASHKVIFTKKPKPAVVRKPRVYECEGQLSLFDLAKPPTD